MDERPDYPLKQGLMEQIGTSRKELEAYLASLTSVQFELAPEGVWNVKDNLAHLIAWEQSIVGLLHGEPRHQRLGVSEALYLTHDLDAINHEIYLQHRDQPLDTVFSEFHASHREIMRLLSSLGDDDLRRTYSSYLPNEPGEDSGAPIIEWIIGDTSEHYAEHLQMIRDLFNDQRLEG